MPRKMMKKPEASAVKRLLRGICLSVLISAALASILSVVVIGGVIDPKGIPAAACVICAVSAFFGAQMAMHGTASGKLGWACGAAGGYVLVLLVVNLLFIDGAPVGIGRIVISCLIGALAAGLLAGRRPKPAVRRRK